MKLKTQCPWLYDYPSSKTCSACGHVEAELELSTRVFKCAACGASVDRDENAAINLRKLGLAQLPEGLREVKPVESQALARLHGAKPASTKQEAKALGVNRASRGGAAKRAPVHVWNDGSTQKRAPG